MDDSEFAPRYEVDSVTAAGSVLDFSFGTGSTSEGWSVVPLHNQLRAIFDIMIACCAVCTLHLGTLPLIVAKYHACGHWMDSRPHPPPRPMPPPRPLNPPLNPLVC